MFRGKLSVLPSCSITNVRPGAAEQAVRHMVIYLFGEPGRNRFGSVMDLLHPVTYSEVELVTMVCDVQWALSCTRLWHSRLSCSLHNAPYGVM